MIKKVMYAVGNEELENYFTKHGLEQNSKVVGTVVHRGAIIPKLQDISLTSGGEITLILNEGLPDKSEGSILQICQRIRIEFPNVRILLLAGDHKVGDDFLSALLTMGVYDVVFGEKLNVNRVIEVLHTPNTYADALSFVRESNLVMSDRIEEYKEPEVVTHVAVVPEAEDVRGDNISKERPETEPSPEEVMQEIPSAQPPAPEKETKGSPAVSQKARKVPHSFASKQMGRSKMSGEALVPVRQTAIFGVSDSYNAREIALSVAHILASDKRVLLVDITKGSPLLPTRLNTKVTEGLSFFIENMDPDVDLGSVPTSPYLMKNKAVSPSLYILPFGAAEKDIITAEEFGQFFETIRTYGYDHVLYVGDHMSDYDLIRMLGRLCDHMAIVGDQYSVTVNRVYEVITECKISPYFVLAESVKAMDPTLPDLLKLYGLKQGIDLEMPRRDILRCDSLTAPYIGKGPDRRKLTRLAAYLSM